MPRLCTTLIACFLIIPLLLQGVSCHDNAKYECPKADLAPCTCEDAKGRVYLRCSGLSSGRQLEGAVRGMSGRGITQLEVRDSNVSFVPHDLFRGSPVSRIVVRNCMMFYLFDRELDRNAEHVTDIELERVHFEGGLDWSVLENLRLLKTVVAIETNVENIPYGASELELPLESLMLENNYIDFVYETAFQNLKRLRNLQLSKNFLKVYQRSMLPLPTSGIQFLDLSFNQLQSLPKDAFEGMPELHSLLLAGNQFSVLEKATMKGVFPSLFNLDVSENPLVCSCELTWTLANPKPYHLKGQCTSTQDAKVKRNLRELTKADFAQCT